MNLALSNEDRPSNLQDRIKPRLAVGFAASVVLNLVLWRAAAAVAKHPPVFTPQPVEITRVILDDKGYKTEKVVTKHDVLKRVEQAHKQIEHRKPMVIPTPQPSPHPIVSHPVKSPSQPVAKPQPPKPEADPTPPPPEGAHNNVLTALDRGAPKQEDHTALKGGNAAVGQPIEAQNPGNNTNNPPNASKTEGKAPPKADAPPVKPEPPKPQDIAPPVKPEPPKPQDVAPPVETVKPEPPKPSRPKGPTREAQPDNQAQPEIPDELKHSNFKSFVRVKVEIDADGSFTPILRTSSGNTEIDNRVLEALKRWRWKPALKDGMPVKSVQLFKFEFEVQ